MVIICLNICHEARKENVLLPASTLEHLIVWWLVLLVESSHYGLSADYLRQGYCLPFYCSRVTVFGLLNISLHKIEYFLTRLYHALLNAPFRMPACFCKFLAIKHQHFLFFFIPVSFLPAHLFLLPWILC